MTDHQTTSEFAHGTGLEDLGFRTVPKKSKHLLNEKQRLNYRKHREQLIRWLTTFGKNPESIVGYAPETVRRTAYRIGAFDRWAWEQNDGYCVPQTQATADAYLKHVAYRDVSNAHRHKILHSLKRYFRWRTHEFNEPEWEPELSFSSTGNRQPPDFLSVPERRLIRQAALEYGNIPDYSSLPASKRTEWKRHVSQRLRKPMDEVTPDDWKQVNGWKHTTITWTSLDAGLRPVEVGRAKTTWVDVDNAVLRIPVEESSKNKDNWRVSITERTAEALGRWLEERENYDKYSETDALWLTRESNPYGSRQLKRLLVKLCDIADIRTDNRNMSWYSIRHSVGTYMTREEDLAAAKAQLRHKSVQTTMKYDQAPVEDRRDALGRMG